MSAPDGRSSQFLARQDEEEAYTVPAQLRRASSLYNPIEFDGRSVAREALQDQEGFTGDDGRQFFAPSAASSSYFSTARETFSPFGSAPLSFQNPGSAGSSVTTSLRSPPLSSDCRYSADDTPHSLLPYRQPYPTTFNPSTFSRAPTSSRRSASPPPSSGSSIGSPASARNEIDQWNFPLPAPAGSLFSAGQLWGYSDTPDSNRFPPRSPTKAAAPPRSFQTQSNFIEPEYLYSRPENLYSSPPHASTSAPVQRTNRAPSITPYRPGCTAFVTKLFYILEKPQEFGDCIRWIDGAVSFDGIEGNAGEAEEGFIVDVGSNTLINEVLPDFFSHNNITSFLRQLEIYSFQRLSTEQVEAATATLQPSSPLGPTGVATSSRSMQPVTSVAGAIYEEEMEQLEEFEPEWRGYYHSMMKKGDASQLHLLKPRQSKARTAKKEKRLSGKMGDSSE